MLLKIVTNDNLLKFLYYNDNDPLSHTTVPNIDDILFQRIFPFPFTPSTETEQVSILNIYFNDFRQGQSVFFKDGTISVDVICHQNIWRTNSGLRPFLIMSEIDGLLNLQSEIAGIGKLQFERSVLIFPSTNFIGYKNWYRKISST